MGGAVGSTNQEVSDVLATCPYTPMSFRPLIVSLQSLHLAWKYMLKCQVIVRYDFLFTKYSSQYPQSKSPIVKRT